MEDSTRNTTEPTKRQGDTLTEQPALKKKVPESMQALSDVPPPINANIIPDMQRYNYFQQQQVYMPQNVLSPPNYQYAEMRDEDIVTGPTEKFDMDRYTERLTKLFKNGCQCKRRGCLDSLKYEDFYNNCLNFRKLPWKYQNYVLMGALNCGFTSSARCEAEKSLGVEEHEKHRGPKFVYFVLGQNVCRDVFCVFYGTSRRRIVWLSKNLREKGFLEVAHGNSCLSKSMKTPRKIKDSMSLSSTMMNNNPMQNNLMVQQKDMKNTNMNTNPLMYAPSNLQTTQYPPY